MIHDSLKGFLPWLLSVDDRLLLFVNSMHSPFFDTVMWLISDRYIWIPFYVLLAYLLFRHTTWKRGVICLLTIAVIICATDQTCATLIRPVLERLRPSNIANPISPLVHTVNGYRGGNYGFPSCHAANTFALAVFMSLQIHRKWFTTIMLTWAILVSYSRMYLGVHYFGDLLCGALIGAFYATTFYYLQNAITARLNI